jgi:hypothetical protein
MAKIKRTKEQTRIYKTLHRKHKIKQHETHQKPGLSQVLHQWHPSSNNTCN